MVSGFLLCLDGFDMGPTLFWHIFFHSRVEFLDGFFVLGGAKVGVDFAGDFYAGVAKDALGGDGGFDFVHKADSRAVAEPGVVLQLM